MVFLKEEEEVDLCCQTLLVESNQNQTFSSSRSCGEVVQGR